MSTISIGSASISAPMGMVVGTAKIDPDLQEISPPQRTYSHLISSPREMTFISSGKQSFSARRLGTSRKTRLKRLRRPICSSNASE